MGSKAVAEYLRDKIDIPDDPKHAWKKINRWRKRKWIPVLIQPNGRPYIIEDEFEVFWRDFTKRYKGKAGGNRIKMK